MQFYFDPKFFLHQTITVSSHTVTYVHFSKSKYNVGDVQCFISLEPIEIEGTINNCLYILDDNDEDNDEDYEDEEDFKPIKKNGRAKKAKKVVAKKSAVKTASTPPTKKAKNEGGRKKKEVAEQKVLRTNKIFQQDLTLNSTLKRGY